MLANGPILIVAPETMAGPLNTLQPPNPLIVMVVKWASAREPDGTAVCVPDTS